MAAGAHCCCNICELFKSVVIAGLNSCNQWHTLIKHQGPSDTCCGVQLILTALFGQTYAMVSAVSLNHKEIR